MIDIPEAGRKRDQLIAEIKAWTVIENACRRCQDGLICNINNPETDCFEDACPKWSTNRNDAWELWDEIWESHEAINYRIYTGMTGKEYHEVIAEVKVGDKVHMAYGDSFADAVSQVWLLWKTEEGI